LTSTQRNYAALSYRLLFIPSSKTKSKPPHRADISAETFALTEESFETGVQLNPPKRCVQADFADCCSAAY
jgi:hypothetical protein